VNLDIWAVGLVAITLFWLGVLTGYVVGRGER